jgi:quercetin dioxygenase-like cupin family protein
MEFPRTWSTLTTVEGLALLGGTGRMRARQQTGRGVLLEIEFPAGVRSPEHPHDHDSFIYLLAGHLTGTIDGRPVELHEGETVLHPAGVRHTVEALADSRWLEFKTPPTARLG